MIRQILICLSMPASASDTTATTACELVVDAGSSDSKVYITKDGILGKRIKLKCDDDKVDYAKFILSDLNSSPDMSFCGGEKVEKGMAANRKNITSYIENYFLFLISKAMKKAKNDGCPDEMEMNIYSTAGFRTDFLFNFKNMNVFWTEFKEKLGQAIKRRSIGLKLGTFFTMRGSLEAELAFRMVNKIKSGNTDVNGTNKLIGLLEVGGSSMQAAFYDSGASDLCKPSIDKSGKLCKVSAKSYPTYGSNDSRLRVFNSTNAWDIPEDNKCHPLYFLKKEGNDACIDFLETKLANSRAKDFLGYDGQRILKDPFDVDTKKLSAPAMTVVLGGASKYGFPASKKMVQALIGELAEDEKDEATKELEEALDKGNSVTFAQLQKMRQLVCAGYEDEEQYKDIAGIKGKYDLYKIKQNPNKDVSLNDFFKKENLRFTGFQCSDLSHFELMINKLLTDFENEEGDPIFEFGRDDTWLEVAALTKWGFWCATAIVSSSWKATNDKCKEHCKTFGNQNSDGSLFLSKNNDCFCAKIEKKTQNTHFSCRPECANLNKSSEKCEEWEKH